MPIAPSTRSLLTATFLAACALAASAQPAAPTAQHPSKPARKPDLKPFTQSVPPAAYSFEMIPVPASPEIPAFYIAKTETTWEAFDVYVYRLDEEKGDNPPGVDAVTRPSKPYIPPDRGFGHEGFAAMSVSFKNAEGFCEWMSKRTGRHYRLPTEAEWEYAARAGNSPTAQADFGAADDGKAIDKSRLEDFAWLDSNSGASPKAVASRKPNAWGLYDMLGNVREWVVGNDGKPTTKGGAYTDPPTDAVISAHENPLPAWNGSDPQVPKSKWWLSDGPFIGFRIVCDTESVEPPLRRDEYTDPKEAPDKPRDANTDHIKGRDPAPAKPINPK